MEGVKFTNELVKYVLSVYPRFMVKRWVYGKNYIAIENEAGYIGLTLADPILYKVWRDPNNILDKLDELEPTDLIMMIQHENPVYKYIGHAYINSIVNKPILLNNDVGSVISHLYRINDIGKIVIVGYIESTFKKLIEKGYEVYVVEANLDMIDSSIREKYNVFPWWSIEDLLIKADALLITGSAIPNNTIGYILANSKHIKFKAVVGPSTTMVKEPFRKYGVKYLGGSIVLDRDRLFKYLSEGRGFHKLEKENIVKKVTIEL